MANIYDVALKAGVSISTVSHVLNNTRYVSDETTDKVLAAVDELGYEPDLLARAMVRHETHTIGLIVPDNVNPFFAELAEGVENHGFAAGYSVMLCNSGRNEAKELAYLRMLVSKRVDGVLYITSGTADERLALLSEREIPVVTFDRHYPGVDAILIDNFAGGYIATQHLLKLGHQRIGCISGPDSPSRSEDRVGGYEAALRDAGVPLDRNLVVDGDWTYASGQDATDRLISLPDRPSAIFACNDTMAIGALASLRKGRYRVPDDVSVVGFDNILASAYSSPPLTTIATPIQEIGQQMCQLLLEKISGHDVTAARHITPESKLLVRESTAAMAN